MERRIGTFAGIASVSVFLVLAIYEVQEWKMPDRLAITLVVAMGIMALVATLVMVHGLLGYMKPLYYRWVLQSPIRRRETVNPHQWLIDLVEKQRQNPTSHLVITDRIIMGVHLDDKRPRLWVRVYFTNFGVNDLTISQPEGYPRFGDEQSEITASKMKEAAIMCPAGNSATSFDLNIYIPDPFLKDVRNEVESLSGEVKSINLAQVRARVQASGMLTDHQ